MVLVCTANPDFDVGLCLDLLEQRAKAKLCSALNKSISTQTHQSVKILKYNLISSDTKTQNTQVDLPHLCIKPLQYTSRPRLYLHVGFSQQLPVVSPHVGVIILSTALAALASRP